MNRCPSCKRQFIGHACVSDPGELPDEGDCGICKFCGGWWTIKDGEYVDYYPSRAEMEFVIPKLQEARL